MIEEVLLHVDVSSDRIAGEPFDFTGWVAADGPIESVALLSAKEEELALNARPDVERVFPNRKSIGFSGRSNAVTTLRFAVRINSETIEREYALPAPLPKVATRARFAGKTQRALLRLRERLAATPSKRWQLALRRHLSLRHERGGIFQRRHADALLADFAAAMPDALFLQIGANDGRTGDPLFPLLARKDVHWRGVLVEPVSHLYAQLTQHHGQNSRLQLERAAIGETDGLTTIHHLQAAETDSLWLQQLPSLDPEVLRKGAGDFGAVEKPIVSENVPSLTVATLLARHHLDRLDLLVIDTEGWDWRILRQFDLARLQTEIVLYEHQHLSVEDRAAAQRFLAQQNFAWVEMPEGDTLAWN